MDFLDTTTAGITHLDASTPACSRRGSLHISRKTSWGTPIPAPSSIKCATDDSKDGDVFDDIDLNAASGVSDTTDSGEPWNTLENIAALGLSFTPDDLEATNGQPKRFSLDDTKDLDLEVLPVESQRPFNKWVKNIQKRAAQRRKTVSCDLDGFVLERESFEMPRSKTRSRHMISSSGSSAGFVTAVKSASISIASLSVAPRSRRTGVSSRLQRRDQHSRSSTAGRRSEDSANTDRETYVDRAVMSRLLQRRRVIEEIISSEESYVADAKFLMNVYVTLLASLPSLSLHLRGSINRNLNEIVELHEELLGDLYRVVPHSEYSQTACASAELKLPRRSAGHQRWRSLDAVPEHTEGVSWLQRIPGMLAEPSVAAKVATVFEEKMNRFFVYEEYGAKYELMIKDVASAYRTIPQWEVYQKGLEALAASVSSINCQNVNPRKSLTIGDLLVKPIQRVCKYPLLFAELLKQTPVCDCPESHLQIENVLVRLREATTEINRATDDPRMKTVIERTWLLQDRLVFADRSPSRSRIAIRALGHALLCGVLHVSWQKREGVDGQYLICVLYRDFLLLASAAKAEPIYTVQACITLSEVGIEEVDNGRGLQCHTAPFSWKLVFEHDHQLFEVTLSACSAKEELEWQSRLAQRSSKDTTAATEQAMFGSLLLDIKPLGAVFGKPGTIARRISIQRATTIGSVSGISHVIIKNTHACKDPSSQTPSTPINRSQSHLTTNRIPILAASRPERIRLETLLADVWTRDVLPYPGMSLGGRVRSEHLVRASASSMIRKLSVASIASGFSRRSGSAVSLRMMAEEEGCDIGDLAQSGRCLETSKESSGVSGSYVDGAEGVRPRLEVIQDEKENVRDDSSQGDGSETTSTTMATTAGPGAFRRLKTLRVKRSWAAQDGRRIVTPPLRSSSANSLTVGLNRAVVDAAGTGAGVGAGVGMGSGMGVGAGVVEDKENLPRASSGTQDTSMENPAKSGRRVKGKDGKEGSRGRSRTLVAEGIRNFFR